VSEAHTVVIGTLPVRTVRQASLLLEVKTPAGHWLLVALDVDNNEFVQLPSLPLTKGWRPLSLSSNGTRLLYLDRDGVYRQGGLFLYTLATAERVQFNARVDGGIQRAGLAPDEQTIATLSVTQDPSRPDRLDTPLAAIGVIDVTTAEHRRIWATPGTWSAESVVSWSPDGNRLAVTYIDRQLGMTTVVLDPTGRQIGQFADTQALTSGNGSWLDPEHLVCGWDDENGDWKLTTLNVIDSTRDILGLIEQVPTGRIGNRLVLYNLDRSQFAGAHLLTTDLHGEDPQPWLYTDPPCYIGMLDTWMSAPEPEP
jgi:hypothetical protein